MKMHLMFSCLLFLLFQAKTQRTPEIQPATDKKIIQTQDRFNSLKKDRLLIKAGGYKSIQSLAVRFEQNTGAKIYEGTNVNWGNLNITPIIIDGNAAVEFANVMIKPENAADYRYRVIKNYEKELVGWSIPENFVKTKDGKATYVNLGKFDYQPNQFILIEIYNTKNFKDRDAIIVDWRTVPSGEVSAGLEYTSKNVQGGPFYAPLSGFQSLGLESGRYNFIETKNFKDMKFRLGDSLIRLHFMLHKVNLIKYDTQLKRTINGKTEILKLGDYKNWEYLYKEFWQEPGAYEISFTPKLPSWGGNPVKYIKNKAIRFKFTILPPLNKSIAISYKALGIALISILLITGLTFWYFILRNRMKLFAEKQMKDFALMQLRSVRSQLNPHFMYNALAGIQNLINKKDVDTANRYLGKFARLTRSILDEKSDGLTTIADEKLLLEDYLQMEQLRFSFSFVISISEDIDAVNSEIPSMLLQPFVENAIKHGIAELNNAGKIEIEISKTQNTLLFKITDNGKGFDPNVDYPGLGISLSKNRISLLNTIYKDTPLELQITSTINGSTIIMVLKDWL